MALNLYPSICPHVHSFHPLNQCKSDLGSCFPVTLGPRSFSFILKCLALSDYKYRWFYRSRFTVYFPPLPSYSLPMKSFSAGSSMIHTNPLVRVCLFLGLFVNLKIFSTKIVEMSLEFLFSLLCSSSLRLNFLLKI